ncbi:alpha/beta fold hydrolase [Mycolicibacterium sp. 120266]|uniref:alpha/beta fold hydrolase n=1 Tax=Mycolicibacterium sp. 120266 TaxID=3090601 RepID=UPI00299E2D0D|nr:alpha/beta fold hydrolase [Mycolicibacterium sp. 120266]MDX1871952.1 alpha/beta fold hydrolase [Mycolicibacterium sp. 120266]
MVARVMAWLAAVFAMTAVTAALLAGAAVAAADPDAGSAAGSGKPAAEGPRDPKSADPAAATRDEPATESQRDVSKPSTPAEEEPAPTETAKSGTTKKKASTTRQRSATPTTHRTAAVASATKTAPVQEETKDTAARPKVPSAGLAQAAAREPSVTVDAPSSVSAAAVVTARPADRVVAEAATPRRVTPVDAIGSVILNAVMGLVQFFAGPPVLPADANVTVRTSTLRIPVAGGRTVTADWYFPTGSDDQAPARLIYLQHGFGAVGSMYSFTATALAERTNSVVVAPTITSNFLAADGAWLGGTAMQQGVADLFAGDRAALTASASAAAGREVTLPTRFVLVGHSAGGSLVMGAANDMIDNGALADLAGVVLLDSVDMNGTVPKALARLTGANDVSVLDISSERYVWNMFGAVGDELEAARPGQFNGVMLTGGRHIDALLGGNKLVQFAEYLVAGFSAPANVQAVPTIAAGWINDLFAGTREGYYPAPGHSVEIPTSSGVATAVALPFASGKRIQATPLDGIFELVLGLITRVALFDTTPDQLRLLALRS